MMCALLPPFARARGRSEPFRSDFIPLTACFELMHTPLCGMRRPAGA